MANNRHLGRVIAMQALYELDAVGGDPVASVEALGTEYEADAAAIAYSAELIQGVLSQRDGIDGHIEAAATQWPLDQMALVDKAVLRVAVFELVNSGKTPRKVAINEAIEIAKTFGGESSGRFVNGVLGHVAESLDVSQAGTGGN